jgi:hypothetical protein
MSNCCRNLLTKDDWRAALAEEAKPRRPKVARIVSPNLGACAREGLAGAGARPNRSGVVPSGKSEGVTPAADAGEEVALKEAIDVGGLNIGNTPFIDFAIGNQPFLDQFA